MTELAVVLATPFRTSLNSFVTGGVSDLAIGFATASQLPGRGLGGPADVLRHLVLSSELTRRFGADQARGILNAHEAEDPIIGPDSAHDQYIKEIGITVGTCKGISGTVYRFPEQNCWQLEF
jgi:hypothetical protein